MSSLSVEDVSSGPEPTTSSNASLEDTIKGVPLMSDFEKQALRNEMNRQLARDLMNCVDYYHLTTALRKVDFDKNGGEAVELLRKLYPDGRNYTRGYAGSFGEDFVVRDMRALRIGARANAPRTVMDPQVAHWLSAINTASQANLNSDTSSADLGKFTTAQMIENLYEALLQYEEANVRITVPSMGSGRDHIMFERAKAFAFKVLNDEAWLKKIVNIRKGNSIAWRWIVYFGSKDAAQVLVKLLRTSIKPKLSKERAKDAFKYMESLVGELEDADYMWIIQSIDNNVIEGLLIRQIGFSALILLMDHGASIYSRLEPQDQVQYSAYFQAVTEVFAKDEQREVAVPIVMRTGFLETLKGHPSAVAAEYLNYWEYLIDCFKDGDYVEESD